MHIGVDSILTSIKDASILTMRESLDIVNGDIYIKDDRITYMGNPKDYKGSTEIDLVIDAGKNLVMPGFKNAHAHCPMVFARSYADGLPLDQWLNNVIYKLESKLTAESVYWFTQLAYMEYLSGGITASFNMYYEPEAIKDAAIKSGFRTVLCGAINNFKESVELLESYYNQYNIQDDLISYKLGFHAEYTTKLSMMERIADLAHKYRAPVHVHNSETKEEVEQCIKRYKMTPTEVFDSLGMYNFGGSGFHATYLSEHDMEIFKERNVYAVINACSNAKLASGVAPVETYLDHNLNLAIGTDGASSNNALDMFREMYLISMLQKVSTKNPQKGDPEQILRMATLGGAHAMGLYDCDVLAPGKKADLIMLDLKNPCMQPMNDIIHNLVYSGNKSIVMMTMINGRVLYRNGQYTMLNADEVIEKVNEMITILKR